MDEIANTKEQSFENKMLIKDLYKIERKNCTIHVKF